MHWPFADIGAWFDKQCFFNEEAKSSNDCLLAVSSIREHTSDHLACSLCGFFIKLNVPNSVDYFDTSFAHSSISVCSFQYQSLEQTR